MAITEPAHAQEGGGVNRMYVRCRVDDSPYRILFWGTHFENYPDQIFLTFERILNKDDGDTYPMRTIVESHILLASQKKALDLPEDVMPSPRDDFALDDARRVRVLQYEGKARGCCTFQDFQELLSKILLELQLTEDYRKSVAGILNKIRHALGLDLL